MKQISCCTIRTFLIGFFLVIFSESNSQIKPQPLIKPVSSTKDTMPAKGKLPSDVHPQVQKQITPYQKANLKLPVAFTYTLQKLSTPFYIPPRVGGDGDFGGHGPVVGCTVSIQISSDKLSLIAHVDMDAKETQSDWTEAKGSHDYTIFTCISGQQIESISGPASSSCNYTDNDHDDDFILAVYGETGTQAQNSFWKLVKQNQADLVAFYRFTGDTEGDEAGSRTGVQVSFNPLEITLSGNPIDEIQLNVPTTYGTCGNNTCGSSACANLLSYYGVTRDCNTMKTILESSSNLINVIHNISGYNIGIDPNSIRDRLNEIRPGFTLDEINNPSVISTIINQLNNHKPVLALTGWGSKTVLFDFARNDDNVSLNPNSVLHYIVVDGYNRQTGVFSIVSNGERQYVSTSYLQNTILWHPENIFIEGALYPNQVKPGKIIY